MTAALALAATCLCGHLDGEHFDEVGVCSGCECRRFRGPVAKTVQFANGGLFDAVPIGGVHLVVRNVEPFDPATLCGLPMFGPEAVAGWSLGGGIRHHDGSDDHACIACGQALARDWPGVPLWGSTFAHLFTRPAAPWSQG